MRDILSSKEFTTSAYHTGSVPLWLEERKSRQPHRVANGVSFTNRNGNGHHNSDKEKAAAIGVAMAFALQLSATAAPPVSLWRLYGRWDQLLSRTMGNRRWLSPTYA